MKIAFFGTWEFSRNILKWVLEHKEIEVSLVVSQPDKPVGRKKEILATPIKALGLENNIKVLQPKKLRNNKEFFEELNELLKVQALEELCCTICESSEDGCGAKNEL